MKRFMLISSVVLLFLSQVFLSCASSNADGSGKKIKFKQEKFDKAYDENDFDTCLKMLQIRNKKAAKINYMLDEGMFEHMTEDFDISKDVLGKTCTMIDDAFTKSITKSLGATALNDNIADYAGNIYEYILINGFEALNYYKTSSNALEEALVEIRQFDVKNREYVSKYGEIALLDDTQEDANDTASLSSAGLDMQTVMIQAPKKPTEDDIYKDSAFMRYLGLVLRTMDNDMAGNNEVDGRFLASLNSDFSECIQEETVIPDGMGRLDILSLCGKISQRQGGVLKMPVPILVPMLAMNASERDMEHLGLYFTFPYVDKEEITIFPQSVTVGEASIDMKLLENFDCAVQKDVAVVGRKAFKRSIIRSCIKKIPALISAEAAAEIAINQSGNNAIIVIPACMAAVKGLVALDVTEKPDIRQCAFLPKTAFAGGINLISGVYDVCVTYSNGTKDLIKNVEIKNGEINLVESVCLK